MIKWRLLCAIVLLGFTPVVVVCYAALAPMPKLPHLKTVIPIYTPASISEFIIIDSFELEVPWHAAMELAKQESGLRADARRGDDCGVMQLDQHFFHGACAMTAAENIRKGIEWYSTWRGWCQRNSARPVEECATDRYRGKRDVSRLRKAP